MAAHPPFVVINTSVGRATRPSGFHVRTRLPCSDPPSDHERQSTTKTAARRPGVNPLATGCRLLELRHWLAAVDVLGPAADVDATVTSTGNSITVG
jgi:hypothetical protein